MNLFALRATSLVAGLIVGSVSSFTGLAGEITRARLHRPIAPRSATPRAPLGGTIQNVHHNGTTLVCSDCHSVHASQQHGFAGETSGGAPFGIPYADPPHPKLLKRATATELCLACHDGLPGVPDVVGVDVNGLTERAAGWFDPPDISNFHGHNIAKDPGELCSRCHFSGTFATATVGCIDCHAPHGNQNYRNLQWASFPGGEPEIRALSPTGLTGMARYEQANVRYPAPSAGDTSYLEVTTICSDCHHTFMDQANYTQDAPGDPWLRHPGTYTEAGSHRPVDGGAAVSTNPDFWVNGTFATPRVPFIVAGASSFAAAGVVDTKNEVFCLTCHKAHGSSEPFGLRWHYGGLPRPVTSDGCQQCHKDR